MRSEPLWVLYPHLEDEEFRLDGVSPLVPIPLPDSPFSSDGAIHFLPLSILYTEDQGLSYKCKPGCVQRSSWPLIKAEPLVGLGVGVGEGWGPGTAPLPVFSLAAPHCFHTSVPCTLGSCQMPQFSGVLYMLFPLPGTSLSLCPSPNSSSQISLSHPSGS